MQRGDDPTPRQVLAQAIERLSAETTRLTALQDARTRAHDQWLQATTELATAQDNLFRLREEAPQRRVAAFTSDQLIDDAPLHQAELVCDSKRRHSEQLSAVENALEGEIQRCDNIRQHRQSDLQAAMATVLTGSPEFLALFAAVDATWVRLRSLRAVCDLIAVVCSGALDQQWLSRYQNTQPLEADRVGYDVDRELIDRWARALEALQLDADAPLPEG
jgi:hypothetical protein